MEKSSSFCKLARRSPRYQRKGRIARDLASGAAALMNLSRTESAKGASPTQKPHQAFHPAGNDLSIQFNDSIFPAPNPIFRLSQHEKRIISPRPHFIGIISPCDYSYSHIYLTIIQEDVYFAHVQSVRHEIQTPCIQAARPRSIANNTARDLD